MAAVLFVAALAAFALLVPAARSAPACSSSGPDGSCSPTATSTPSAATTTVGATTSAVASSSTAAPVWPDKTPPVYTPTRIASTADEFQAIMDSLRCGDVVEVKPMTLTGEVVFGQRLDCPAEIHFDPGVRFSGYPSAGSDLPAVWIHGAHLHLYGGEVSNAAQDCVRIQAGSVDTAPVADIRWWGVSIHDCAMNGLSVQGTGYPNTRLDIAADISRCGQNLSLDPHYLAGGVAGTGLHGAYLGGAQTVSSGQFELTVHDQPTGYGVEVGSHLHDSQLWIRATNITGTYGDADQSGSALALWGGDDQNVSVNDLEVSNVARQAVETSGLWEGANANLVVAYARATGVGSGPAYGTFSALSYGNLGQATPDAS